MEMAEFFLDRITDALTPEADKELIAKSLVVAREIELETQNVFYKGKKIPMSDRAEIIKTAEHLVPGSKKAKSRRLLLEINLSTDKYQTRL